MSIQKAGQQALTLRTEASKLNTVSELRMTGNDHSPHGYLLLIKPEDDIHFSFYVERESHLDVTAAQTEVACLQAHRHI